MCGFEVAEIVCNGILVLLARYYLQVVVCDLGEVLLGGTHCTAEVLFSFDNCEHFLKIL
jgi:ubiquitin C-terminal hydrolase